MKATNESTILAKYIKTFINQYVPSQKYSSYHTLESYSYAISLYLFFWKKRKVSDLRR
jgi:hypothetical protein